MPHTSPICEFLREGHVPRSVVPQGWTTSSAHSEAAAMHVRGRDCAKVVVCLVDGKPIEAILHASLTVNLTRLLALTGGSELRLPNDEEVERLFPKRDRGTMPTFSPLYGQSVFVDVALVVAPEMVFKAGADPETICVRWADFAKSVRPIVGKFAEPPLLWARYRLSPRE